MTQTAPSSSRGGDWLGLADRVCVVTGAGSGIGRGIALGLAEAGGRLVLLDRDKAGADGVSAEIKAAGGALTELRAIPSTLEDVFIALSENENVVATSVAYSPHD